MDIKEIQDQLPWTIKYSSDFRANPQPHKDFTHALIHIIKACGHIAEVVDDLDHRKVSEMHSVKFKNYVSDLVICAMRMANTSHIGKFDLQKAVKNRLESKKEVKLT